MLSALLNKKYFKKYSESMTSPRAMPICLAMLLIDTKQVILNWHSLAQCPTTPVDVGSV